MDPITTVSSLLYLDLLCSDKISQDRTYNYTWGRSGFFSNDRINASLLAAASDGRLGRVKQLLELGADVDYREDEDITALHYAIWAGHEDVAELLLKSRADANAASSILGTSLCLAVLKEQTRIIEMLLKEYMASVDLAHPTCGTPLHCAAFIGNESIAVTLLDLGAKPDTLCRVHLPSLRWIHKSSAGTELSDWERNNRNNLNDLEKAAPLALAVFENRPRVAAILVGAGASVDQPCDVKTDGMMQYDMEIWKLRSRSFPLGIAAFCGFADILEWLILKGADVHSHGIFGIPPILLAGMCGNFDTVRAFRDKYKGVLPITEHRDVIGSQCDCERSWHWKFGPPVFKDDFSSENRDECMTILCNHSANVNVAHTSDRITPLLVAARSKRSQCVKILLRNQADPNSACGSTSTTALHWSAYNGDSSMMSALLEAGADLRTADSSKRLLLILAIENRHPGIVDMILTRLDHSNVEARDPTHTQYLNRVLSQVLGQRECMQERCLVVAAKLIQLGAKIDTVDELGSTALHCAASSGKALHLSTFLDAGVQVNIKDRLGRTALHYAAGALNTQIISKLLIAGAEVDALDRDGNTTLHCAASIGHYIIVSILLDAGASVNLRGQDGQTPLHIAARRGRKEVVSRLLVAGADADATCKWDNVDMRAKDWAKRNGHYKVHDVLIQHEQEVWQNTSYWTLFHNALNWFIRQLFG
jgi:ankyrin repeat protein